MGEKTWLRKKIDKYMCIGPKIKMNSSIGWSGSKFIFYRSPVRVPQTSGLLNVYMVGFVKLVKVRAS